MSSGEVVTVGALRCCYACQRTFAPLWVLYYLFKSGMPGRALRTRSPIIKVRAHVVLLIGESVYRNNNKNCSQSLLKMGEELPILKGILNGVVNYHNARRCLFLLKKKLIIKNIILYK